MHIPVRAWLPSGSFSDPHRPLLARSQIRASPTRRSAWSRTRRPSARSRPATRTMTRRCWRCRTPSSSSGSCPSGSAWTVPAWLPTACATSYGLACQAWMARAEPAAPSRGPWRSGAACPPRCRPLHGAAGDAMGIGGGSFRLQSQRIESIAIQAMVATELYSCRPVAGMQPTSSTDRTRFNNA